MMKKICLGTFILGLMASTSAYAASSYVKDIKIEGLKRVEPETVLSYIDIKSGQSDRDEKMNEALKPFYSFFAASLAALRRSSLYGAVSRKEKRPFSISNSLQPVSGSTSVSLQTAGCLRLYAVSLFLRSVLWVRMKMVGSFSSK